MKKELYNKYLITGSVPGTYFEEVEARSEEEAWELAEMDPGLCACCSDRIQADDVIDANIEVIEEGIEYDVFEEDDDDY